MDAMNNPSVLEFQGCLFGTIGLLDLSNMKLSCTEIWVVTKYLMRKFKEFNENFKAITDVRGIDCKANIV